MLFLRMAKKAISLGHSVGFSMHNLSMLIGYEKCILVVHDWGGVVGFDTVLRYPDIVDKFIICNIPHPKGMQDAYNLKQFLMSW